MILSYSNWFIHSRRIKLVDVHYYDKFIEHLVTNSRVHRYFWSADNTSDKPIALSGSVFCDLLPLHSPTITLRSFPFPSHWLFLLFAVSFVK